MSEFAFLFATALIARLAQHLSQRVVRNTIIVIGLSSAAWLMRR